MAVKISKVIREMLEKNPDVTKEEVLKKLPKNVNKGTVNATFSKLRGGKKEGGTMAKKARESDLEKFLRLHKESEQARKLIESNDEKLKELAKESDELKNLKTMLSGRMKPVSTEATAAPKA